MTFPAARLGDQTVTTDNVLPPCNPTVLIGGAPAACVGDMVYGTLINYAPGIIMTGAFTVLIGGRPAARVTSMVNGLTIGPLGVPVPVTTTLMKGQPNVLLGDMGVPVPPPPEVQAQMDAMAKEAEEKQKEYEEEQKEKAEE